MKNTKIFFLLLVGLFAACKSKQKEIIIIPDREKNHLQAAQIYGKVESIHTYFYSFIDKDSSHKKIELYSIVQNYSPDGYLLNTIHLNTNKDTVRKRHFNYDKQARRLDWKETDSVGNIIYYARFEYDTFTGFLKYEKRYKQDSLIYSIRYQTDGAGNIIETQSIGNGVNMRSVMQYNALGLVEKIEEYTSENRLFKSETIDYDNYGDAVNRTIYGLNGSLIEYEYSELDPYGRLIKRIYEDRMHNYREDYFYELHDEHKNWTKETKKIGDQIVSIKTRDFLYY
jgi:hypothetical protein